MLFRILSILFLAILITLPGCTNTSNAVIDNGTKLRATGDLGIIIERSTGSVQIIENSHNTSIARLEGLGDLSHASVVFSRDARFAYIFGRDGGLTKLDLLTQKIAKRIVQAGNSIGGAISTDGRIVASQNYTPGGIKLFDADTLEILADIPTFDANGKPSRVVGLADFPQQKFVFSLFDADAIWMVDANNIKSPTITRYSNIGRQPYDALGSTNGRYYLAGLYGEDGLAMIDFWQNNPQVKRILPNYGKGEEKLPVYKMPHLRGWSIAGDYAFLPAIGRHEVLIADNRTWQHTRSIAVHGQPVFVMAEPSARRVWVNFAFPHNDTIQIIDVPTLSVIKTLKPAKAILHMEFTAKGESVWLSSRDENKVIILDTQTFETKKILQAQSPSGIFFTWRSTKMGM